MNEKGSSFAKALFNFDWLPQLSTIVWCLLLAARAWAQPLQGHVVSAVTLQAIPFAKVISTKYSVSATADQFGFFKIELPAEATGDSLLISAPNFATDKISLAVIKEYNRKQFRLKPLEDPDLFTDDYIYEKEKNQGSPLKLPLLKSVLNNPFAHNTIEWAHVVKIKQPSKLYSLELYIESDQIDSVMLEIHFYQDQNGSPGSRINTKRILRKIATRDGWVSVKTEMDWVFEAQSLWIGVELLPDARFPDQLPVKLGVDPFSTCFIRQAGSKKWSKEKRFSPSHRVTLLQS
ncbi:MAG TPA: hypothetical protein VFV37_02680 [Luteibaculaceae bacterium]|nr:hypothetical protein [Luteibaculaceae bacterium]